MIVPPVAYEWGMWAMYITLQLFYPVLREGVCAILIMIDIEDFENDDGRYLRLRTCSPERQNMSSWKLTCNSPRCKRLLV